MEKIAFYVVRTTGKTGKDYVKMYAVIEEQEVIVSFDREVISEISDISLRKLNKLELDVPQLIGYLVEE